MTSIDIMINTKYLTDYSRSISKNKSKKTILKVIEKFSYYILNLYGRAIEESINSRRYRGKWEPVDDEGYIEYLGVTPKIPIIYLIKDALEVKKIGFNFLIRINPKYKYPGTRIPLVQVIRAIEHGTSKFDARPLFSNSVRFIRKNIDRFWRGYLSMKGVI